MFYTAYSNRKSGYTLVELSVVIGIISVMAGSTLALGSARIDQQRVNSTKERMDMVERALFLYAEVNGRLPCPGNPQLNRTQPHFGHAATVAGDCMSGAVQAARHDGEVVSGSIPAVELALPQEVMFDSWGRKITYAIDRRFTRPNALRENPKECDCGSVVITDEADRIFVGKGMFVLVSHGKDGHGAYHSANAAPWRLDTGITHAATLQNAGITASGADAFTARFRQQGYYRNGSNAQDSFDDILLHRSRSDWTLASDTIRHTTPPSGGNGTAGWIYIPEYTLPDGTAVPAFEVMAYEAADPQGVGGNGIPATGGRGHPVSRSHLTPWTGISYENARRSCQMLGGTSGSGMGAPMEYDIWAESQWLSVAHQTASQSRNWTSGFLNDGVLYSGHSDNSPAAVLDASDDHTEGYYKTQNPPPHGSVSAQAQRRTFFLPNGAVIWDFAGNASEYSYCDLPAPLCDNASRKRGLTSLAAFTANQHNSNGTFNYHDHITADGLTDIYLPPHGHSTAQRTGVVHNTLGNGGGAILRGGDFRTSPQSGIYSWANATETSTANSAGFRCVRNLGSAPDTATPDNISGLTIWYDASDLDGNFSEDWDDTGTSENGLLTSGSTCNANDRRCVQVWRNKAGSNRFHARSRRLNGSASGNDSNMPTYKLNAINGRPAVNFSAATPQWLDTHHGISNDPAADNGAGFGFNGAAEFSFFVVANASRYDAIIAATDANAAWWPHFVLFPYNIGNRKSHQDYVLLIDNHMAGENADNNFCRMNGALLAPLDLLCLEDTLLSNQRNYACAQMGGIDNPQNGLTHHNDHIATGIFRKGTGNGLSAYVNGGASHPRASTVRPDNRNIGGDMCLLGLLLRLVELKLNIGMNRHDKNTRTIGDVAEIIIYNRALSNKERVMVEKYLSRKYNIEYKGP